MKPTEDFIDVEPIQAQIIACPKCGQKNRIPNDARTRFRCGACKFEFSPSSPFSRTASFFLKLRSLNMLPRVRSHIAKYRYWYALGALAVFGIPAIRQLSKPRPGPMPYRATPPPDQVLLSPPPLVPTQVRPLPSRFIYVRPATTPNSQPWPTQASYIKGFPRLRESGLSEVTVDNSQNDTDVFVKLVSLQGPNAFPVRTFFIPANATFTINNISVGAYDIRYRDLANGTLLRSESFRLEELQSQGGIQYSTITMTLYKVVNGNMHTYALLEEEF